MAVETKKTEEKARSALSQSMRALLERDPSLRSGKREEVLDLAPVMAKARLRRAAGEEPEFSPREHLRRASITAPLIERLVAADAAAYAAGRIAPDEMMTAHHLAAADEIRQLREAGGAGGAVQAVDWGNTGGGGMRGTPLWPSGGGGGQSEYAGRVRALCFDPWWQAMTDNPPVDGRGRPIDCALFVVISAVLQSPALRELEARVGIRNGQAKRVIRVGLSRYTTFEELMSTRRKPRKAGV